MKNCGNVYTVAVSGVLPVKGYSKLNEMLDDDTSPLMGAAATDVIRGKFSRIPIHKEIKKFYNGNGKYGELWSANISEDNPFDNLQRVE